MSNQSLFERASRIRLIACVYADPSRTFQSRKSRCVVCDGQKYVKLFSGGNVATRHKQPCRLCNRSVQQSAEVFALQKLGELFAETVKEEAMTFKSAKDLETIATFYETKDYHCLPEDQVYASDHPNLCNTYYFRNHLDDFTDVLACVKRLARRTKRYLKATTTKTTQ